MLIIKLGNNFQTAPKYFNSIERVFKEDISKRTQKNLNDFEELFKIKWCEYYKYSIFDYERNQKVNRKGTLIYGCLSIYPLTFFRKESIHYAAGQTKLYFLEAVPVRVTQLLNLEEDTLFKFFKNLDLNFVPNSVAKNKYVLQK